MSTGYISVGLVGGGRIARLIHLPVLASLAGVDLVGVADPDETARRAVAALVPGLRPVRDLDELIDSADLDAVVICSPPSTHAALAIRAFAARASVYVEKPVAMALGEAQAVAEAHRAAGTIGMTGFMLRFSRPFIRARALISAGEIGEVVAAHSIFSSPPFEGSEWRSRRDGGGAALLDLFSHHADLARWLLRTEIVSVTAQVRSVRSEDDTALVTLRTTAGAHVQTLVSTSAAEDHRFEILGTEARLAIDPWRMASPERIGISGAGGRLARLRVLTPGRLLHRCDYQAPFRAALSAFAAAVRSDRPCAPDLSDGLASLAIVEAAQLSARTGAAEVVPVAQLGAARTG